MVPGVSLTRADTLMLSFSSAIAFFSIATTSCPSTPEHVNPFVQLTRVPESRVGCSTGNEKVKPIGRGSAASTASGTCSLIFWAMKANRSLPGPVMIDSSTLNLPASTEYLPSPRSVTLRTRKLVPPRSSARKSPFSCPLGLPVRCDGSILRLESEFLLRPDCISVVSAFAITSRRALSTRSCALTSARGFGSMLCPMHDNSELTVPESS
mmetsp:Transcript_18856/g.43536  ORF Transcript_18856/g.43536 Transcript_18856/m.43536 type:complete len:210 (-) Transcript_18856:129-758(-)